MATQQTANTAKSAANDLQSLFDPRGYQDVFKTMAGMNERLTRVVVEAASRNTDIVSDTTKEALSNVRELAQVRDEPADYSKAYSDFVQKQMELFSRSAQAYADVTREATSETTDLASKAGSELTDRVAANVDDATDKATSATKKAS